MTEHGPLPATERAPIYANLLASDNAATAVVLQTTVNLTIATATYLTATAAVLSNYPIHGVLLAFLPAPVYLMNLYQLVLAGSVRRRVESTRLMERCLFELADLTKEHDAYRVGSRATEAATDPDIIKTAPGGWKFFRSIAAALPYAGFYGLSLAYTGFVVALVFKDGFWAGLSVACVYSAAWVFLIVAAVKLLALPLFPTSESDATETE